MKPALRRNTGAPRSIFRLVRPPNLRFFIAGFCEPIFFFPGRVQRDNFGGRVSVLSFPSSSLLPINHAVVVIAVILVNRLSTAHMHSKDPFGVFALVLTPVRELAFQVAENFHALAAAVKIIKLMIDPKCVFNVSQQKLIDQMIFDRGINF